MPKITINGKRVEVEDGLNVLEAAKRVGVDVPHYCYHRDLAVVASCRMCLVEVEKAPKLLPACATIAAEGMVVQTETPKVKEARERVLEFLLLNHPLDCPICDQAGECFLQDYSYQYGTVESRFHETKRVPPKKDLGGDVILYSTRCILCTRCTRFMSEVAGTGELGVMNRGARAVIDLYPGRELSEGLTGNIIDICPVGALKSKDFLFQARVWNLEKTPSVCGGCSVGCNIRIDSLRSHIKRFKPRENRQVNGAWICDAGRFLFHEYYDRLERLTEPEVRGADGALAAKPWSEALHAAAEGLGPWLKRRNGQAGSIAVLGSAHLTNEENFLLRRFAEQFFAKPRFALYPAGPSGEDRVFKSGFRIAADKSPNRTGALAMLGLESDGLEALWKEIESGAVRAAILTGGAYQRHLGERELGLLRQLEFLLVLDSTRSELTEAAHVLLPGAIFTEKDGTMTNDAGRVQRLHRAVAAPGYAREESAILRHLSRALGEDLGSAMPDHLFAEITGCVAAYAGITLHDVGDAGLALGNGRPEKHEAKSNARSEA